MGSLLWSLPSWEYLSLPPVFPPFVPCSQELPCTGMVLGRGRLRLSEHAGALLQGQGLKFSCGTEHISSPFQPALLYLEVSTWLLILTVLILFLLTPQQETSREV